MEPTSAGKTTPSLIPSLSQGFTSVSSPSTGIYCLVPSEVASLSKPATVSGIRIGSSGIPTVAELNTSSATSPCTAAAFEVETYSLTSHALSAEAAFMIAVV